MRNVKAPEFTIKKLLLILPEYLWHDFLFTDQIEK